MSPFSKKLKGLIYGQAIGDALGLGTEFMSKSEVASKYPRGLHSYDQIIQDRHRHRWPKGAWTDDTDQMLCILDSILENQHIDIHDIAARLRSWVQNGGMGIGQMVMAVVSSRNFLTDSHAAAREAWEMTSKRAAPNGGIMRTSILGAWQYKNLEAVKNNTEQVCRITHYDPRCVGSCVAVSVAPRLLLQEEKDVPQIMSIVRQQTDEYSSEIAHYLDMTESRSLDVFDLDEGLNPQEQNRIGYTLKAMGAAFWALRHTPSFRDGIEQIIHEGGDADTNAAVAGALLGARDSIDGIPEELVFGLQGASSLEERLLKLQTLQQQMENI